MKGTIGYQLWFVHTCSGYAYEHVQTRKFTRNQDHCENLNCRDCVEEAGYLYMKIGTCICWFVYDSVKRLYCTKSSCITVLYEIVSWFMIYIIYDSGVFSFMLSRKNFCVMCSWYFTLWLWLWTWFNFPQE